MYIIITANLVFINTLKTCMNFSKLVVYSEPKLFKFYKFHLFKFLIFFFISNNPTFPQYFSMRKGLHANRSRFGYLELRSMI